MSYKVNYDSLGSLCDGITGQANQWSGELSTLSRASNALANTSNMSGQSADAVRAYILNVHQVIQGMLGEILTKHSTNCLRYFGDYQTNVDDALHT